MAGEDTDTEVLTRAGLSSVYTMLMKTQLRWAGHIVRMLDHRLPKKLLFGELQEGQCSRGAPKKPPSRHSPSTMTLGKLRHRKECGWRAAVYEGAKISEARKTYAAEQRRPARKDSDKSFAAATIPCLYCPRLFQAMIGVTSHLCTHFTNQTPLQGR